jgi:hypothetical protein
MLHEERYCGGLHGCHLSEPHWMNNIQSVEIHLERSIERWNLTHNHSVNVIGRDAQEPAKPPFGCVDILGVACWKLRSLYLEISQLT